MSSIQNTFSSMLVASLCILALCSSASHAFVTNNNGRQHMNNQVAITAVYGSTSNADESVPLSSTSRRVFFKNSAAGGVVAAAALFDLSRPLPANAAYGDATKVVLPSYIDFLIEKNKVFDPSTSLYKGADVQVQLERLLQASKRLEEIPALAETKKWSQVQSILTGPLVKLILTMNQLSTDNKKAKQQAAVVKNDLVTINQGAAKKSVDACIQGTEAASKHLEDFVKTVFES